MNSTTSHADLNSTLFALRQQFDQSFSQPPRLENVQHENLLAIRIGGDPYAIRISEITGLYVDQRIMPLPTPVKELLGVTGFRGRIVPVYDLAALLGYPDAKVPRWFIQLRSPEIISLVFDHFESHLSVPVEHIVSTQAQDKAHPTSIPHLSDAVRIDQVLRPIIQLQSLLQDIQQRADISIQQRSLSS